MFKKAATVAFKGETRLRGKETKRLKEAVASHLGGDAIASVLLPAKADILTRKAGGGTTCLFVFVDGDCFFVQLDGRAEVGDAELFPTLPALWRTGLAEKSLPCVIIQRPVAKFVFGGANVMSPGVHSVVPAEGSDGKLPSEGDLVAVRALGNPSACAVGRLKQPASSLGAGSRGEAVEVLHYFGDFLWEACGSVRPDGFVGQEIRATEEAAEVDEGSSTEGDLDAAGVEDAGELEASATCRSDAKTEAQGAEGPPPATVEDMNRALEDCLLQAVKTRIKDKDLPLSGNNLYAQHMRPCRRVGSNLDVKASTFKKLVVFLTHAEAKGWIALKSNSPEPIVTRIFRNHPDVQEWQPWTAEATAEAAEGGSDDKGGPSATISVESVWKVAKLAALLGVLGSSQAEVQDGVWTREDCLEALKRYADAKGLWLRNNKKRIGPDDLLQGLIGEAAVAEREGALSLSLDSVADCILGNLQAWHRVITPQGGAAGGLKTSIRSGKPPIVQIRNDTRRGHNVTLVHGLEAYGMDMEALAACLQKALATSASVEEASGSVQAGVLVQGFWEVSIMKWLEKAGIPQESMQQQGCKARAHQTESKRKVKQATNIIRG